MYKKIIVDGNEIELKGAPSFIKKYALKKIKYGENDKGFEYLVFYFEEKQTKKQIMSPLTILDNRGQPTFLFKFLNAIGKAYEDIPVLDDYLNMLFVMKEQVDTMNPMKFYKNKDGSTGQALNMVVQEIALVTPESNRTINKFQKGEDEVPVPKPTKVKSKKQMEEELADVSDFSGW